MKLSIVTAFSLLVASTFAIAAAPQSGLQVGDRVPAYHVNDCTGPNAGKSLCYRCKYGKRPVVNIFTREMTPEVTKLVAQIDATVAKNSDSDMKAFVVHLTDDTDASETALKKVAKDNKIKNTPLTNFDGKAGPSSYKIAKDAEVTVMMWVNSKVKVNHALKASDLSDAKIKEIVGDSRKILN